MAITGKCNLPDAVRLLELCGFEFAVDYDHSLVWRAPESIDVEKLGRIVEAAQKEIAQELIGREAWNRVRCNGGPWHGKHHGWAYHHRPVYKRERGEWKFVRYLENYNAIHIARGHWAVYRLERDGRAFFVGYAASEAKAKRGTVKNEAG